MIMKKMATSKTGVKVNGKLFTCILDAIEYRDKLDAHYIKIVWEYV